MKAIVNIGLRLVELQYSINKKDLVNLSHNEICKKFNDFELDFGNGKSKKVTCKHSISFKDFDEWKSILLFDGRIIDFHYDYENRKEFDTKSNWGNYVFQGYEYINGKPQLYDNNVVDKVIIQF